MIDSYGKVLIYNPSWLIMCILKICYSVVPQMEHMFKMWYP